MKHEKNDTLYVLAKIFEKEEYAKEFRKGKLYMNTIGYFKQLKDRNNRGDSFEGLIRNFPPDKCDVLVKGQPLNGIEGSVKYYLNELLEHNIYCMYKFSSEGYKSISKENLEEFKNKAFQIHNKNDSLGNFAVVITNVTEFQKRCLEAFSKTVTRGCMSSVIYYDEKEIILAEKEQYGFIKNKRLQHQKEYRILVDARNGILDRFENGAIVVDVGDISDITSDPMPPEQVNKGFTISLPDGSQA